MLGDTVREMLGLKLGTVLGSLLGFVDRVDFMLRRVELKLGIVVVGRVVDGKMLGIFEGAIQESTVGDEVGNTVGSTEGITVGSTLGLWVGTSLDACDGNELGDSDGEGV